ncbi:MAG: putative DNA modification/repair radical SAM protein [Lachnospiraceae bacterium]|jgi:putative DNA modification/repair radical SAM protein|nr:putative DNA modification/repair radical SAM protein [Lachnospiraceae bacterium]
MLIQENLSIQEKLTILTDAAKYDVACTSSGVGRKGKKGSLGNTVESGICHSFSADGRCISLLKILFTNQCIYDCKYCINRCSNDTLRTSFTPEEVCRLTMEFYQRNYIEGLFLSSGILHSPDYTMEQIFQVLWKLRRELHFNGYIHVKAIPGADPALIEQTGFLADRMSVNLELPTAEGLKKLAPGKTRDKILKPMKQIQTGIAKQLNQEGICLPPGDESRLKQEEASLLPDPAGGIRVLNSKAGEVSKKPYGSKRLHLGRSRYGNYGLGRVFGKRDYFVPAGQSTQMIVGATPESDFQMLAVAEALYQKFGLKRVFYSAYISVNEDSSLPILPGGPPLLREHRLYQADWLMRYYGFDAGELLSESQPNFNVFLDPKCDWALRHLEQFPVEVNRAGYEMLLRVPGMGVKSVGRIVAARKTAVLTFADLKKMGVVLKRAQYFITCSGKLMNPVKIDQDYITSQLLGDERRNAWDIQHKDSYRQLSLFDDMHIERIPDRKETAI